MNKFDELFFTKYLPEGLEIKSIIHKHIFLILGDIILNYFFGVLIPSFLYYNSLLVRSYIPFFILEILIFFMFFRIMYKIFGWYNDVWLLTKDGIVEVKWQLFEVSIISVKYHNIEGVELIQSGILDSIFGKGDLVINKIGGEDFVLKDAANVNESVNQIDKKSKEEAHLKIEKVKKEQEENSKNKEKFKQQNFETLFQALSGVVEDYLGKSGYEKSENKEDEIKSYIKEIKKKGGTIDIR